MNQNTSSLNPISYLPVVDVKVFTGEDIKNFNFIGEEINA